MGMGASFPEQCVSILRMANAALSRHDKTSFIAICYKSLRFEGASANMRREYGSRGSGSRQDALLTEEAVGPRASDEDLDILAAYRKPKNKGWGRKRRMVLEKSGGRAKGG